MSEIDVLKMAVIVGILIVGAGLPLVLFYGGNKGGW